MAITKRPLPKLADLHKSPEEAFKKDELKLLLNQPPHQTWIKKHPFATVVNEKHEKVKAEYLPIDKVEFNLDFIFQDWKIEIKNTFALFNSVCSIVRVHYVNPVSGEWMYHDGVGAAAVQTDKDASAADLSKIKSSAVQMAAPSSVSYAIKDACEHLGKLFGRDLNRKDTIEFIGAYEAPGAVQTDNIKPMTHQPQQQNTIPPPPPQPIWNGQMWVTPDVNNIQQQSLPTKLPF